MGNHEHHAHPHLGIPSPYLLVLCAGGTVAGLGVFHPENTYVASLIDSFIEIYDRNSDKVSPLSVVIHLMTVSEVAYEMIIVSFITTGPFALVLMGISRNLGEKIDERMGYGNDDASTPSSKPSSEDDNSKKKKKKKTGKTTTEKKESKNDEDGPPVQEHVYPNLNPNAIEIKWAILICVVVWFLTTGTIYSCSKVPSFVMPETFFDILPVLSKCVPWRFGPYSLISHVLILGFTPYLFHPCGRATGIAYSIYLGFLAQVILLASWMVRAKSDPFSIFTTANIPARFNAFVLLAHIVLTSIFFLPKFLKDKSLVGIGSFIVVGIISAMAATPQFATINNLRILNTFIFTAIGMSAVLGGISIIGSNVVLMSIILQVHSKS